MKFNYMIGAILFRIIPLSLSPMPVTVALVAPL